MRRDVDVTRGREPDRSAVEGFVARLLALANNEEAGHLLGVEGVLAEIIDISMLEDPLDYVTYDIAAAIFEAQDDRAGLSQAPMLATLVAELKLCGALSVRLEQGDLVQRVVEQLRGLET